MNVIHLISNKVWGGGERYALDLCRALRADGHTVMVFTRNKADVRTPFGRDGLLSGTMRLGGAWDFLSPIRIASALRRLHGPVVIHVHNFKDAATALAARRLCRDRDDIRVVATRHLVRPAKTDAAHHRIYADLDAIVFVSDLARREFLSTSPAVDTSRLHVVHNSVALPSHQRRDLGDTPVRLIYLGRIAAEKGLDTLIDALLKLKDLPWTLDVFGTGSGKYVLPLVAKTDSEFTDGRVHWLGHCSDIAPALSTAHVAVVPSRAPEAFGLSIIEAFSQETAVVSTDSGAQTEIITDGENGLLVPPDNPVAMADALRRIITDPALRLRLAAAGLDSYNTRFGYSRFYNSILNIYNGLPK